MGTPDFAVPSLEILLDQGYEVVAVITATDKPRGRGRQLSASPVKKVALARNIPVLQPTNLKAPSFLEELKSYEANLQVVVAFRMLPEVVWSLPEYGTFNLHASLLPQYRGAAPINWAIINGEKETGLTTFFIRHEIDTGNMIMQSREAIGETDTAGDLHDRLMVKGADLVLETVHAIEKNDYVLTAQPGDAELKKAPKIFKEDCRIVWNAGGTQVYNFIRGLSPYPGAWTILNDKTYKIFSVTPGERHAEGSPGTYRTDNKTYLSIKTKDSMLDVLELQSEGKKRMQIGEFLRGNKI
jgi:methionyl-tRNA formyltransferase